MNGTSIDKSSLSTYSKASLVLLPFFGITVTANASAQVIPVEESTATVVEAIGNQFDITGGQLSDNEANLFHNFEQFDLSSGQTANFNTISSVENVVGKVSGKQASTIDGTLQVSGSDANLYLMNPAGILLGPDSQLNLSGGFTATTATGIEFESGQFNSNTINYEQLTGSPTSFLFENDRAGAVINSGNLSVENNKSLELIGGTVVNTGSLSAPEGTVTVAAVEGESRIRISQKDRLLSLEVEAVGTSLESSETTAQSIGSMLTGSGLNEATALITEPDGTVRLGSNIVDEARGEAIASGRLSARGETGNINVLGEYVSLINANLDVSGTNGGGLIRVGGDYQGQKSVFNATQTLVDADSVLNANAAQLGDGGRVIVWADKATNFSGAIEARGGATSGSGGFAEVSGKQLLQFDGNADLSATQGNFGTLLIDPENIEITDGVQSGTANTTYFSSADIETLFNTSNLELIADNNISIRNISNNDLEVDLDRNVAFRAGTNGNGSFYMDPFSTIRAEQGDVLIEAAGITVGDIDTSTIASTKTNSDLAAGSIALISRQGIEAGNLTAFGNHQHGGGRSPHGGNITLVASDGSITTGFISSLSDGDHVDAGDGGRIEIDASESVTTQAINSSSIVPDGDDEATAGAGGDISVIASSGDITIEGGIDTRSWSEEGYGNVGGKIELTAVGSLAISDDIVSSSIGEEGASDAGSIEISATNIAVGRLNSTSETDDGSLGKEGTIRLTADRVEFGDGADSIRGDSIEIVPLSASRNIEVGKDSDSDSDLALSITNSELMAIGNNVRSISIGRADSTGDVRLASSVTSANVGDRAPINIVGAETLFGPNEDTVYDIKNFQSGLILGSGSAVTRFSNVSNIVGGSGNDRFLITPGVSVESFGKLSGGGGNNILDYTNFTVGINLPVQKLSDLKVLTTANAGQRNSLIGTNADTDWRIYETNSGTVESIYGRVEFEGFTDLTGGDGADRFIVEDGGKLTGGVVGGDGKNTLSYAEFNGVVEVDLQGGEGTGDIRFSEVKNFIGNGLANSVIRGLAGNDEFSIMGDRSGIINNSFTFSDFGKIDGYLGNDKISLAGMGADDSNQWIVDEVGGGSLKLSNVSPSRIEFEGFEQIEGNANDDFFDIEETGFVESISGEGGFDTVSYGSSSALLLVDLQEGTTTSGSKQSAFFDIEAFVGNSQNSSSLYGSDSDNAWRITGVDSGFVDGVAFTNFNRLLGKGGNDTFSFESSGLISGEIEGGEGKDSLDYSDYRWQVELSLLDNRIEDSLNRFSEIENVVGNSTAEQAAKIVGSDRDTTWQINSPNSGEVEGLSFRDFSSLISGKGNDQFEFLGDGRLTGLVVGGEGIDTLNYEGYTASAVAIYPNRILGEENAVVTSSFSEVERIVGNGDTDVLHGSEVDSVFEVQRNRSIKLGELLVSGVSGVAGEGENAVLDYRLFDDAIAIDLENSRVVDELYFENIANIVSNASKSNNIAVGTSGDDSFEIVGDREIAVDGMLLSGFSTINGSAGNDRFVINETTSSNILIKGGNDELSAQNLIVSEIEGANWRLSDKNTGRIEGPTGTILAEFSQIQRLENDTSDSEHRLIFGRPTSQLTGSINSGESDLVLVGDNINIGNNDRDNNLVGGQIAGTGTLAIRSATPGISIELGGQDDGGDALSITSGEVAAIQDNFSQVTIGDRQLTDELLLKGDVSFENDVTLQASQTIDAKEYSISADGSISLASDRIAAGAIDSLESVSLTARNNITVGSISAREGVEIESEAGSIAASGQIATSAQQSGDGIRLSAQQDIVVGDLITEGKENSGSINISSTVGGIRAAGISTSGTGLGNATLATRPDAIAGGVTLSAQEDIEVEFIAAADRGDRSGRAGFIKIETAEDFRATGLIPGTETSLSTAGVENGTVSIRYGNPSRPQKPFLVGRTSDNGTVGGIRAALEIVSGEVPSGIDRGDISIIDLGYPLTEPRQPEVPLKIVEPLPDRVPGIEISVTDSSDRSSVEILRSLETGIGEGFENYLNLSKENSERLVTTLEGIQQTLQDVERKTQTAPALVYVYFVPDASSEASVSSASISSQSEQLSAANDQLEVMLINSTGEPVRKRRWGVTREQVEAASLDLRQQITSQFTSASQYLKPAQQLYDWIIRPIAKTLEEDQVESIGFVMDTGLRTVPLAALHDGDRYLVENYSLGLLPTFSLTEFQTEQTVDVDLDSARVLAMGASEFEEQPDLPAVDAEIDLITQKLWEGDAFLNEDFVLENLQAQIKGEDYGVVHLATHASFESGDLDNSYIQLWDEKLALDDIGKLGLDESNVSLIILSACNTALGDRASEYGFAGFAVTSGSQTALASLWPVNDEGTLGFMSQFYSELRNAPVRAEALRQAQISLLRGEVGIDSGVVYDAIGDEITTLPSLAESGRWDFSHPFFWSAFTMVGNPW